MKLDKDTLEMFQYENLENDKNVFIKHIKNYLSIVIVDENLEEVYSIRLDNDVLNKVIFGESEENNVQESEWYSWNNI